MISLKTPALTLLLALTKIFVCEADETQKKSVLADSRKQAELLPAPVWTPAPDINDRSYWNSKRNTPFAKKMIYQANLALKVPPETPSREYYLDYSTNGNRTRYEKVYSSFRQNFESLAMALCLTGDREKYLKAYLEYNKVLCNMPTWVLPAHDKQLENLNGTFHSVDLVSSYVGATVAIFRQILSPLLPEEDKKLMAEAVRKQVIIPYVEMARKQRPHTWVMSAVSNWNAVCNANTMLVLLASDMPADEKMDAATLILASIRNYYKGFSSDGYCTEGIAYWSYGFGNYMKLAATLHRATAGKLDLMTNKIIRKAALFPERFALTKASFPAFADCSFNAKISAYTLYLRNWLLNYDTGSSDKFFSPLHEQLLIWGMPPKGTAVSAAKQLEKTSSFPTAGIFIFRHPQPDGLNFVCKGGSNQELHNHNDVGSFTIACGSPLPVVGDLGGTVYTRDTFTNRRYENKLLCSYGHPVPFIGNTPQSPGKGTQAKVLKFAEKGNQTEVVFDIRKAYPKLQGVKKLQRRFCYDFSGRGKVVIEDQAAFSSPLPFETALPTFGKITLLSDGKLRAEYRNSRIDITVNSSGIPWTLKHETLNENTHWKDTPQRYAVCLEGKHKNVKLTLTITPAE